MTTKEPTMQDASTLTDPHAKARALAARKDQVRKDRDSHEREVARLDEQLAEASAQAYLAGTAQPDASVLNAARLKLKGLERAEAIADAEHKAELGRLDAARRSAATKREAEIQAERTRELRLAFALLHLGCSTLTKWDASHEPEKLPYVMQRHVQREKLCPLYTEAIGLRTENQDAVVAPTQWPHIADYSNEPPSVDTLAAIKSALNGVGIAI